MFLSINKINSYLLIFFIFFSFSCSTRKSQNINQDLPASINRHQSINVNNLMFNLLEADKKLTPKLITNIDGSSYYRYIRKPGEGEISLQEIKKRMNLGSDFYKNDREEILDLLTTINEFKINNRLENIESGALGLWLPYKDLIIIDYKVVRMGSPTFLDTLRHEVIHVAQSCFNNSRKSFPKRIGLPLEFSQEINLNLSHFFYSKNGDEVMNIEREAFTYSKVDGAAKKLLNKFCE